MASNVSSSVTEVLMARKGPLLQIPDFSLSLRVLSFFTPELVAKDVFFIRPVGFIIVWFTQEYTLFSSRIFTKLNTNRINEPGSRQTDIIL
jgi:hypothetical protein